MGAEELLPIEAGTEVYWAELRLPALLLGTSASWSLRGLAEPEPSEGRERGVLSCILVWLCMGCPFLDGF